MASRRILALLAVLAICGNGKHARTPHSLTKLSPPATESLADIFVVRVSDSVTSLILNNFYKIEPIAILFKTIASVGCLIQITIRPIYSY